MISIIADKPALSDTTRNIAAYVVLCLLTFYAARELWSAWRAGSIKSKVGLIYLESNARAFRSLVVVTVLAVVLFALASFAAAFVLASRIDESRDWLGVVFGLLTLSAIVTLSAKYSRKPDSANRKEQVD